MAKFYLGSFKDRERLDNPAMKMLALGEGFDLDQPYKVKWDYKHWSCYVEQTLSPFHKVLARWKYEAICNRVENRLMSG